MKKNRTMIVVMACLLVAATGVTSAVSAAKQKKRTEAELAKVRKQLAELQNRAARPRPGAEDPSNPAQTADGGTNAPAPLRGRGESPNADAQRNRQPRESFEERIARMKEEDPEGYAEMVKSREELQQKMRYNLAERTATIMDLDTSSMTEEERQNHTRLVEIMGNIWMLSEKFQDPEQPPDREAMGQLFSEIREARPLMEQERTIMFKQLGQDIGYAGGDAAAFAEHVEAIISATSIELLRGGGAMRGGQTGRRQN